MFHKKTEAKLFSHDSLFTSNKEHSNLIAKENLVDPLLFNKLDPYEFLFLGKEKKTKEKF